MEWLQRFPNRCQQNVRIGQADIVFSNLEGWHVYRNVSEGERYAPVVECFVVACFSINM